ncbi:hypothetical protein [Acrocarpospora sp. B8E8]
MAWRLIDATGEQRADPRRDSGLSARPDQVVVGADRRPVHLVQ